MIVALVLLLILGLSVLVNISLFMGELVRLPGPTARRAPGPRLQEVVLRDNDSGNKIALIEVQGIISGRPLDGSYSMVDVIKVKLDRAEEDDRVRAVLLKVESPGGEVLASDEIALAIQRFQERSGKPVICSMGSVAASGGYYISAPCQWIVANQMTITGSIGVIMGSINYRGLMDKIGVVPMTYKSGKFKDMLSGSRPPEEITDEEKQMVQNMIDEVFHRFQEVVDQGRSWSFQENAGTSQELADNWQDYADGRVLSGKEAYRLGFVDELGNMDVAIERVLDIAGIKSANVVRYQHVVDLAELFRIFGKTEAKTVKLDLGVELPKLLPGRLYYLSPLFCGE